MALTNRAAQAGALDLAASKFAIAQKRTEGAYRAGAAGLIDALSVECQSLDAQDQLLVARAATAQSGAPQPKSIPLERCRDEHQTRTAPGAGLHLHLDRRKMVLRRSCEHADHKLAARSLPAAGNQALEIGHLRKVGRTPGCDREKEAVVLGFEVG